EAMSNQAHRSRNALSIHSSLALHSNHAHAQGPCVLPRHKIITARGAAMQVTRTPALLAERSQERPRFRWRTNSAEKHISPSTPQPKACAKKTISEMGTNSAARSLALPS